MQGFLDGVKEFGFYSECNGKPWGILCMRIVLSSFPLKTTILTVV